MVGRHRSALGSSKGRTSMRHMRPGRMAGALALVGLFMVLGTTISAAAPAGSKSSTRMWAAQGLAGTRVYSGQVPVAVHNGTGSFLRRHAASSKLTLNFAFPLRNKAGLDRLIARQAKTHRHMSRAELYRRFSPPQAQVTALANWLTVRGFKITHVGHDRLTLSARASTATIQRALGTKIADFRHSGVRYQSVQVKPYAFFANTTPAQL